MGMDFRRFRGGCLKSGVRWDVNYIKLLFLDNNSYLCEMYGHKGFCRRKMTVR